VGRYRSAVAAGFVAPSPPNSNDGPLGSTIATACTYSTITLDREDYALSCVSWATARSFCQHAGGDLPTEAQWEHMATLAAASGRSRYVWGDAPPSCERAVYGRMPLGGTDGVCQHLGQGPEPISSYQAGDVSLQGVVGAAGGVGEWMRDTFEEYRSLCWSHASVFDPHCWQDQPTYRSVRGGSWAAPPTVLRSAARLGSGPTSPSSILGFRCVYPAEPEEQP